MNNSTQLTPHDVISESAMQAIRMAVFVRRQDLIASWLRSFNSHRDPESLEFWSASIRKLNDAAIELGMGYNLDF